jgi:hypothetical protein
LRREVVDVFFRLQSVGGRDERRMRVRRVTSPPPPPPHVMTRTCCCPHFSAYSKHATPQSKLVNCCCLVMALMPTVTHDLPSRSGQHMSNHSITAARVCVQREVNKTRRTVEY